jgi:hypothetical protein
VAKLTPGDEELRLRLCAHLRRLYAKHEFRTQRAMAEKLGIDPGHFSVLFNNREAIGLDVAVKMHRVFGESLDYLCDTPPDARFYPPGTFPGYHERRASEHLPIAAEPTEPPYTPRSPTTRVNRRRRRSGES